MHSRLKGNVYTLFSKTLKKTKGAKIIDVDGEITSIIKEMHPPSPHEMSAMPAQLTEL